MIIDDLEFTYLGPQVVRMRIDNLECEIIEAYRPLRIASLIFYDLFFKAYV
jgi:hypothetical protein